MGRTAIKAMRRRRPPAEIAAAVSPMCQRHRFPGRRAEAGDEIILTRHGHPVVRLAPVKPVADATSRKALLDAVRASAGKKATAGPDAARSQDFLYGEDGLPG